MNEWVTHTDPNSGFDFYYNTLTGESTWENPNESKTLSGPPFDSSTLLNIAFQGKSDAIKEENKKSKISISDNTTEVLPLRKLSQYAIKMELNKNYAEVTKDHLDRLPFCRNDKKVFNDNILCIMCKIIKPIQVFFPCDHLVVCDLCIKKLNIGPRERNDPEDKWIACPLCMEVITKVLPFENGLEIDKYWSWVYEVRPPLPKGFVKNFKSNTEVILSIQKRKDKKELVEKNYKLTDENNSKPISMGCLNSKASSNPADVKGIGISREASCNIVPLPVKDTKDIIGIEGISLEPVVDKDEFISLDVIKVDNKVPTPTMNEDVNNIITKRKESSIVIENSNIANNSNYPKRKGSSMLEMFPRKSSDSPNSNRRESSTSRKDSSHVKKESFFTEIFSKRSSSIESPVAIGSYKVITKSPPNTKGKKRQGSILVRLKNQYIADSDAKEEDSVIRNNSLISEGSITDKYKYPLKFLGAGSFAKVHMGIEISTSREVAIKCIEKKKSDNLYIESEIEILKILSSNKNILKLLDVYETEESLFIVTEIAKGGHLLDKVSKNGSFAESDAVKIIKQFTEAVQFMHENGVVHRDLKPENLLIASDVDEEMNLLVCDFGLAKYFKGNKKYKLTDRNKLMKTACGSRLYCAPEVLKKKKYSSIVDMWGVGITLYILLSGHHPFEGGNPKEQMERVMEARINFDRPQWKIITEEAKDLVRKLLCANPDERFTPQQLLAHTWITEIGPKTSQNLSVAASIQNFTSFTGIIKVILKMLYEVIDEKEMTNFKMMFNAIDKESKGYIDVEGVARFLNRRLSRSKSLKGLEIEFEKSTKYRPTSPKKESYSPKKKLLSPKANTLSSPSNASFKKNKSPNSKSKLYHTLNPSKKNPSSSFDSEESPRMIKHRHTIDGMEPQNNKSRFFPDKNEESSSPKNEESTSPSLKEDLTPVSEIRFLAEEVKTEKDVKQIETSTKGIIKLEDFVLSIIKLRKDILQSNLKKIFAKMDNDKDGTLSFGEMKYWFQKYDITIEAESIRLVMEKVTRKDYITYDDFFSCVLDMLCLST